MKNPSVEAKEAFAMASDRCATPSAASSTSTAQLAKAIDDLPRAPKWHAQASALRSMGKDSRLDRTNVTGHRTNLPVCLPNPHFGKLDLFGESLDLVFYVENVAVERFELVFTTKDPKGESRDAIVHREHLLICPRGPGLVPRVLFSQKRHLSCSRGDA
jgi:hypothetical protein